MVDRRRSLICLALFLGAVCLRLPALTGGLWFDEIWLLSNVGEQTLFKTLTTFKSDNNHPLYSILSWFPVHWIGPGPVALRLVALVFGALSVVAAYRLAALFLTSKQALVVALLLLASSHHVAFSTNARGYTALMFFSLDALYWFRVAIEKERTHAWWRCALALSLATFVHMTGVFLAVGLLIGCIKQHWWTGCRILGAAAVASLLFHASILGQMLEFFGKDRAELAGKSEWTDMLWALGEVFHGLGIGWVGGVALMTAAAVVGLAGAAKLWTNHRWFVLTSLASPVLLFLVLRSMGRNLWPRLFFFLVGLLVIIAVKGAAVLLSRWRVPARFVQTLATLSVLAVAWGLPTVWSVSPQDYPAAAKGALHESKGADIVITVGLSAFPYESVYPETFQKVDDAATLQSLRARPGRCLVLYTFPLHLQSRHPEIWKLIWTEGREISRTPGRIHGGDLVLVELL